MPRHHKANKRAASRRHPSATASPRPSSNASTTRPLPPASFTPTQTRMSSHMQAAPMPQPPATVPAPDSPPSHHPQHRQDAQDHRDRRAHPDQAALKERAFALSCIGHRSPAIAAQLGVSERTIRHWNRATLRVLALDASRVSSDLDLTSGPDATTSSDAATGTSSDAAPDTDLMEYHRALAIERQLDIAVTARAAYDRLMAQHDKLLAQFTAACDANIAATAAAALTSSDEASAAPLLPAAVASIARLIPQLASSASRQLQIAQAAHREVARLQGVTTYAQTDARLCAEYDHKQAEQAAASDEEQGGLVPVHFFDANAALDTLCGPDEEDDAPATSAPTQNTPSFSAAKTAKTANNSGNDSGNRTPRDTLAAQFVRDPNAVW